MAIFTNQATLSYNSSVTTSNITTGELLEVLSVSKTAAETDYTAQDTVTYVVSITNGGSAAFSGLTVTDDLGGYNFDGGTVTNTATVSGAGLSTPINDSAVISARQSPELTISKSLSPLTVSENGQLTYTFVIQNTGNTAAVATDNASVTDTFSPILSDLSVAFNGAVWTEGVNYTYDAATGLFTTVPGQITVPAATYTQNTDGVWVITPGTVVLTVTGTV